MTAMVLALSLPALTFDAAVGHFAGKSNDHWGQWVPIYFGPPAALALLVFSLPKIAPRVFRMVMQLGGLLCAAVGLAGTWFHLIATIREVGEDA
ncbi:MAG TPA: hypothetical protein VEY30_01820, partial [Myxococcaceae bacterium]|nr:hypothetical protein [Myxococcaceae bacterium]